MTLPAGILSRRFRDPHHHDFWPVRGVGQTPTDEEQNVSDHTAWSPTKLMYVRGTLGPNRTTSNFSGLSPSIPGEPIGIPGTASPTASGFSLSNRWSATAGTWPSRT